MINWKDLLIIIAGIFFLWWVDKQYQMQMALMYGPRMPYYPQAPMYPPLGPEPIPATPSAPYTPPMFIDRPELRGNTWAGRPRGGNGNVGGPLRLVLQIGDDGKVWGGNY
jgi:hypothetical protein